MNADTTPTHPTTAEVAHSLKKASDDAGAVHPVKPTDVALDNTFRAPNMQTLASDHVVFNQQSPPSQPHVIQHAHRTPTSMRIPKGAGQGAQASSVHPVKPQAMHIHPMQYPSFLSVQDNAILPDRAHDPSVLLHTAHPQHGTQQQISHATHGSHAAHPMSATHDSHATHPSHPTQVMDVPQVPPQEFRCSQCSKSYAEKHHLDRHKRTHATDKPYACEVCGKKYTRSSYLVEHKRMHTGEKPYQCADCGAAFARKAHLTMHRRQHESFKPFKCNVCGEEFASRQALGRHRNRHNKKTFECPECHQKLSSSSNLTRHMRIHNDNPERPFRCSTCSRAFAHSWHLQAHERTHTGDKPYVCEQCYTRFTQLSALKRHRSIHTGNRPFSCGQCGLKFVASYHLKRHLRSHSGEKPYKCHICRSSFTQSSSLKRHLRQHEDQTRGGAPADRSQGPPRVNVNIHRQHTMSRLIPISLPRGPPPNSQGLDIGMAPARPQVVVPGMDTAGGGGGQPGQHMRGHVNVVLHDHLDHSGQHQTDLALHDPNGDVQHPTKAPANLVQLLPHKGNDQHPAHQSAHQASHQAAHQAAHHQAHQRAHQPTHRSVPVQHQTPAQHPSAVQPDQSQGTEDQNNGSAAHASLDSLHGHTVNMMGGGGQQDSDQPKHNKDAQANGAMIMQPPPPHPWPGVNMDSGHHTDDTKSMP